MQQIKIILLILLACLNFSLYAQKIGKPQFKFQDLYSEKEMIWVRSFIQDQQGIMWLAGVGLEKFDGIEGITFVKGEHANSLLTNNIYTAFLDSKGFIWLGYKGAGASRFDPRTERFLHFPTDKYLKNATQKNDKSYYANIVNENEANHLPKEQISAFAEDKQGNIWAGTSDGLYKITHHGESNYQLNVFEHAVGNDKYVFSMVFDDQQNLWMGTAEGLFYSKHYASIDEKKKKFKKITLIENKETSQVVRMSRVHGNKLWLSTMSDGLFQVDLNSLEVSRLFKDQVNWSIALTYQILPAINGDIWLATENGLGYISHKNKELVFYQFDPENSNSIKIDAVFSLFIDKQNDLWIVTEVGIQKLNFESAFFKTKKVSKQSQGYLREKDVTAVFVDKNDNLWLGGANTGLYQQPRVEHSNATKLLTAHQQNLSSLFHLPSPDIRSFFEDSQGRYWVGTRYNGVYKIAKNHPSQTLTRTHYKKAIVDEYGPVSSNWNDAFFEDSSHTIWLANQKSLFFYDELLDKFVRAKFLNSAGLIDELAIITAFHQFESNMLVGSSDGDIFYSSEHQATFTQIQITDSSNIDIELGDIRAFVATNDELWIASINGLFRGKLQNNSTEGLLKEPKLVVKKWGVEQGLTNGNIYNLFIDPYSDNILWLNHPKGISKFNVKERKVYHFDELIGYSAKQFGSRCGFVSNQGRIYFCGVDGVISFNPQELQECDELPPTVILTQLYINNEKIDVNSSATTLALPLNHSLKITLYDEQRNFAFDFAALDYTNPEKYQYAYMLEGFDDNWVNTTAKRRHANYSNIPAGKYIFKVKASNSNGVWNEQGAQIAIIVLPPWYLTWWAKLLWTVLVSFILYGILRLRTQQLKLRSEELEIAVKNRTAELEQAHKTIAAQEKMSSLGTLSAGIAHEINNPTNFVYGSCQNMEADLIAFKEFLSDLAGDDADEEVLAAFEQRFAPLFDHLGIIGEGAQRIKEIVTGLSVFSRSDSDEMELTSIKQCIETTVQLVNTEFKEVTDFELVFLDEPEVFCFPSKINQVLMNLVVNAAQAIKHVCSKPEGYFGKITLTTSIIDNHCLILIADNGMGISTGNIRKIFEPFFTTKNVGEGTGLGLALSYEIIQQHHGELKVESEIDIGTTFKLILPIEQVKTKEGN